MKLELVRELGSQGSILKVRDVFDDGKSVYFVMDRMHHDLLDGFMVILRSFFRFLASFVSRFRSI